MAGQSGPSNLGSGTRSGNQRYTEEEMESIPALRYCTSRKTYDDCAKRGAALEEKLEARFKRKYHRKWKKKRRTKLNENYCLVDASKCSDNPPTALDHLA